MDNLKFYRFGKREHICALAHKGELSLNPATKYGESGLSIGAFDPNELSFTQKLPKETTLDVFCGKTGKPKGKVEVTGTGTLIAESETNYYVFCMSYDYSLEMYENFKADTCLVISDPDKFINQACKSIMKELPGWFVNAGSVRYRSNESFYTLWPEYKDIFYGKEVEEYSNQFEIRIVCVPPKPIKVLPMRIIKIGDLHGYTYITGLENPDNMIESEYSEAMGSPFKCNWVKRSE